MKMSLQILFAMIVGVFYYMVAVAITVYDGMLSLIFQPIIGAIFSSIGILICLAVGSPIRMFQIINKTWNKYWWASILIGVVGFILMVVSTTEMFEVKVYDEFLQEEVWSFNPKLAIGGWLLTLFSVLHFYPPKKKTYQAPTSRNAEPLRPQNPSP